MDFQARIQQKFEFRRRRYQKARQYLFCILLIMLAWTTCGFHPAETTQVQEIYTVKSGDTLRGISERYLSQTGSHSYILEFEQQIKDLNPWLEDRKSLLQPGDQLIICYEAGTDM